MVATIHPAATPIFPTNPAVLPWARRVERSDLVQPDHLRPMEPRHEERTPLVEIRNRRKRRTGGDLPMGPRRKTQTPVLQTRRPAKVAVARRGLIGPRRNGPANHRSAMIGRKRRFSLNNPTRPTAIVRGLACNLAQTLTGPRTSDILLVTDVPL